MEAIRIVLFLALAVVLVLLYEAWQKDVANQQIPVTQQQQPMTQTPGDVPDAPKTSPAQQQAVPSVAAPAALPATQRIDIRTDVLSMQVNTTGGDLRALDLLAYPLHLETPDDPYPLLKDTPEEIFVTQTGLLSENKAPNHHAVYRAEKTEFRLAEGEDELRVPLTWQQNGISVTKTYIFKRGSYLIDIEYRVQNNTGTAWKGRLYRQFQRSEPVSKSRFLYTYTGGVISTEEKPYTKVEFDDMEDSPVSQDVKGGWVAMIQHYFLGAWIPGKDEQNHFYSKALKNGRYVLGMVAPEIQVAAGGEATVTSQLYAGPKVQKTLKQVAPNLELTVDYGWLTILAKPVFWVLQQLHKLFGNWGWAIIGVTVLIKLLFYKLSETSYRSMARMKKLTPRLQQIKERYSDDKQKLNQAMMDLYKREKINPLGGCFPILIQIPVFIALYWVLLESVEMRQAPFILWWNDLSSPDPYYVLPVVMGLTMLLQQKLNPAPVDPMQQKIMMMLPIMFTVFFIFFPQGLVLYWVVNNILSIIQQAVINKRLGAG